MNQCALNLLTGMAFVKFQTRVCIGNRFWLNLRDLRDFFDSVDFLSSLVSNSNYFPPPIALS